MIQERASATLSPVRCRPCAGSGFFLHLPAKSPSEFRLLVTNFFFSFFFKPGGSPHSSAHGSGALRVLMMRDPAVHHRWVRLCTSPGRQWQDVWGPAGLQHRRSDRIGLICDYNPNITLTYFDAHARTRGGARTHTQLFTCICHDCSDYRCSLLPPDSR